ncbi:MAG: hypothetical protein R3241_04780 [Rheinheimera sp.]|nr:hypothetical protein [Rheinheimera sp.]
MKHIAMLGLLLSVIALTACSDVPGEAKIEQLLQQQVNAKYADLLEIDNVKKLNGWSENDQHYTVEVAYTIVFTKSFKAYMDEQTAKPGNPLEKMATGMAAGVLKLQYGDFKAGDEYPVTQQTLSLRKTENGWALAD